MLWLTGTVVVVAPCLVQIVMGCILLLIGTVLDKVYALLLMVGCVLLQTGTVAVVETAPKLVSSGIDAVDSEYITSAWHVTNGMAKVGYTGGCAPNPHVCLTQLLLYFAQ